MLRKDDENLAGAFFESDAQTEFREFVDGRGSMLVNVHGIPGTGKDHFLNQTKQALHDLGIDSVRIDIPKHSFFNFKKTLFTSAQRILTEIHRKIPNSNTSTRVSNQEELEMKYYNVRKPDGDKGPGKPIAFLINDIDRLSFDDSDGFQSVVIDTLVKIPGTLTVITSKNELSWHSWDLRNKAIDLPLKPLSLAQVEKLNTSEISSEEILDLSGGNPRTVISLIREAKK